MTQKELEAVHIAVHDALSAIVSLENGGYILSKRNFSIFFGNHLEDKLKDALRIVEAEECLCQTGSDEEVPADPCMGAEDSAPMQDAPQIQCPQM